MFRLSQAGRSLLDLLLATAIGFMPIVCGLVVMFLQFERKLEEHVTVTLREAIYVVDRLIDGLHDVSVRNVHLADLECDQAVSQLNVAVLGNPAVRSLVLLRGGTAYCSTIQGETSQPTDLADTQGRRLSLVFDSASSPGLPVLAYRLDGGEHDVLVTAYGQVLRSELLGFQSDLTVALRFGEAMIWSTGSNESGMQPPLAEKRASQRSTKYDYAVEVGYPTGYMKQEIRAAIPSILPSLVLIGLLTAGVSFWSIIRKRRMPAGTRA